MTTLSDWKSFPREPGVYLMEDGRGKVLYVGKAKELRSRLHNYTLPGGDGRPQIPILLRRVVSVRCIVTSTEKEALLLENTLIKKHRPPFNLFFRDDKEYLLLRLDLSEDFPRFELVRRVSRKDDGAAYFGPFSSARGIRETLRLLTRLFPLRTCTKSRFAGRVRPCLNCQMGRCLGPCGGNVTREEYHRVVDGALRFLKGEYKGLLSAWKGEMERLSAEMKFEEAARLRDRIALVARTMERQEVVREGRGDWDAAGWHREGDDVALSLLHVRGGRLMDAHSWRFESREGDGEDLAAFLLRHFTSGAIVPDEVLLPFDVPGREEVAEAVAEETGRTVRFRVPSRGDRLRLVELASKNASEALRMGREKDAAWESVASRLAELLSLPAPPSRVEGFDISTLQGGDSVGSMVTFAGGKAAKGNYRKFAVRGVRGQDDFAMMREVVGRRFAHGDDFGGTPDLVLIDGGKGQLAAALAAMAEAGAAAVPVVAISKERRQGGEALKGERLVLPGRKNPLVLPPSDPALLFLMRVRDEAHRFAVTFHRARRTKRAFAGGEG
jgi:excinuclease ABC subunit C